MAPVVLIAPDTSRLNVERAVRRVSAERRALVERLLRVQDRQAALAAWLLLERALEWRYGIAEMGPWAREPGGKPFLARHPHIHFNLSHTAGVAVCAVDDRPVGIDVERVVPLDPDVLSCVMSQEEQASIAASGSPEEAFMRLWTRKEALLKLTGRGLNSRLPAVLTEAHGAALHTFCPVQDVVCSIASRQATTGFESILVDELP